MKALVVAKYGVLKIKLLSLVLSVALYVVLLFGLLMATQNEKAEIAKEIKMLVELQEEKKKEPKAKQDPLFEELTTTDKIEQIQTPVKNLQKVAQKEIQKLPTTKSAMPQKKAQESQAIQSEGTISETEDIQTNTPLNENTKIYEEVHFAKIKEMISKAIKYPAVARRMNKEGVVLLSFFIIQSGETQNIKIERSSGFEPFDIAAKSAIESAGVFPAPNGKVHITVPIEFSIK